MPIKPKQPSLGESQWNKVLYTDAPSHDFCVWLIMAELMRRHHKAPAPLHVKFAMIGGQLGFVDFNHFSLASQFHYGTKLPKAYSDLMVPNVLRPAINMIGAVEDEVIHTPFNLGELQGYVEYDYHIGPLVDAGREGYEIPQWKPPQWAFDMVDGYLKGTEPVVITLRECEGQPERNSQLDQWLRFAMECEKQGHLVLFVRDSAKADEKLPFKTWPFASKDAYIRAALYQRALVNMMVCNGPNTWAIFSPAPYLIFKELIPALPNWEHGQPEGWKIQDHMDVGEQYAWANPSQRLTWNDDTFDNILTAFNQFLDKRRTA